jgi:hypothetical protein
MIHLAKHVSLLFISGFETCGRLCPLRAVGSSFSLQTGDLFDRRARPNAIFQDLRLTKHSRRLIHHHFDYEWPRTAEEADVLVTELQTPQFLDLQGLLHSIFSPSG